MKAVLRIGEMAVRDTTTREMAEKILPAPPKNGNSVERLDPRSASFTREFKRAAKNFTSIATKSPEQALAVLVAAGIYTRTGRLSKNYR